MNGVGPEEVSTVGRDTAQELDGLLNQEAPFDPYTISDSELKEEPDMPFDVLVMVDWMVE